MKTSSADKDTNIRSTQYRAYREGEVVIIEGLVDDLADAEIFIAAFHNALIKKPKGIVLHLPRPKSVTSLFIDALGTAAMDSDQAGVPFVAVVHPKVRLLISMFGLEHMIRLVDRLPTAIESISE
ncbi:MAG: hypothetical protein HUU29_05985 [Planctomycetaceae bacterium]|nr:hypothetical protein [Planctomycetaceae bacterium]